jgi:uncharacterized protein YndB with AHSA1/START domain
VADPVRASVHIAAAPERVYEYFVRPDAMVRWMGDFARLDPRPGGEFTVDVHGAPVRGHYVELEPPHRLVIAWGYAGSPGSSLVEVRLTAVADGTSVELEHRDLPPAEADGHDRGWAHYLARLGVAAPGGDAGPDPGM